MRAETRQANLRFSPEMKDWLRARADANRRSLTAEVQLICEAERDREQAKAKEAQAHAPQN
jgi:hypothetical protein